jgi:hypothetical protein
VNTGSERKQLRKELRSVIAELRTENSRNATKWNFGLGPFYISTRVGSMNVAQAYVVFNLICFATGLALAFFNGNLATIGVALIVGSLFAFGAFIAQFWATLIQVELSRRTNSKNSNKIKELADKADDLAQRLRDLKGKDASSNKRGNSLEVRQPAPATTDIDHPEQTAYVGPPPAEQPEMRNHERL